MPSGGVFTSQNKRRPGAYINFKAVSKPSISVGTRGIVACAMPLTWGPEDEIIPLYSTDLTDSTSLSKIGCDIYSQDESLPFRLLLSESYEALIYRLDSGATKATGTMQSITMTAKYGGSSGNKISAAILEDGDDKVLNILFNGVVKEKFTVLTIGDVLDIDSVWLDFSASGDTTTQVTANAGVTLTGGTNGTIATQKVADFLTALKHETFQCGVVNSTDSATNAAVISWVKDIRESTGRKVQFVVNNDNSADYEGIISTKGQGYKTESETITSELFPLWVAGITAGADVNESNTCREITDAVSIINPIDDKDVDKALADGYFILTQLFDGTVLVEQDINTLRTYGQDKSYSFSKNRVVRCLDEIGNTIYLLFNKSYAGKVDNTDQQRLNFKTQIISYINTLQNMGAVQNFSASSDIEVNQGESIDSVVVDLSIQPVDSMEKLYMTVYVND
jgi:hypothetical protein